MRTRRFFAEKGTCPACKRIFARNVHSLSSANLEIAHNEMQMQKFFSQNYGRCIQQIGDFSCSAPLPSLPQRPPGFLPLHRDTEESFIDEIVNTFDRRMFCWPFGRLSVAIGDHPMCLVSSTRCKKDLSSVAKRSLSLLNYLNVTFSFLTWLPFRARAIFRLAHFLVTSPSYRLS